jgi:hypothetical protein
MGIVYDDRQEKFMNHKRVVAAICLLAMGGLTTAGLAQSQNQPSGKPSDSMGQMDGMSGMGDMSSKTGKGGMAGMEMCHPPAKAAIPEGQMMIVFGDQSAAWTATKLAALPHRTVAVLNEKTKISQNYSGVPLIDLLTPLGVPNKAHGPALKLYLVAQGSDGYRVVYSLGEVILSTNDTPVIIADSLDGKPLEGNFQIVALGQKGQSRWVRRLNSVRVLTVE